MPVHEIQIIDGNILVVNKVTGFKRFMPTIESAEKACGIKHEETALERLASNTDTWCDFMAWMDEECEGEPLDEEHAQEYLELLGVFNPLNLKY